MVHNATNQLDSAFNLGVAPGFWAAKAVSYCPIKPFNFLYGLQLVMQHIGVEMTDHWELKCETKYIP